jgi:hypothetical protein
MAGERKGISYEALLKVVLDSLLTSGDLKGAVHWNVRATGMTVTPDFTIGTNADKPNAVMLVTHSNSAKNSDMKSWRNLGELAECKLRLNSVPNVYNVAFDSVVKDSLKLVATAAFDGQLVVGDRPYGKELIQWIDKNHKSLPKAGEEKAEAIRKLLDSKDAVLLPLFRKLALDVKKLVSKANKMPESLWIQERKRKTGVTPGARTTSVRRGLSKLMIFEDLDIGTRLYWRKKVDLEEVPQYAIDLKLAKKSLKGAVCADAEISGAFSCLSLSQIESILAGFDRNKIAGWLTQLRNAAHYRFIQAFVKTHFSEICDPVWLFQAFQNLHKDPWALVDRSTTPANWPPNGVWLFDYAMEIVKGLSTNANGYGLSQLGGEVVKLGYGTLADQKGTNGFGGGFGISGWARRESRAKFSPKLLEGVAYVIADKLQDAGTLKVEQVGSNQFDQAVNNLINAKLCSYNGFDPLWQLIQLEIPDCKRVRIRACYAEAAGLTGSVAVMTVALAKRTLVNWQSATDQGKDHKVKELCGRAAALRYSWDSTKRIFVPRQGISKLCLVVDGTWTQEDLDTLALAGWDKIFYPDHLDELAAAIV